MKQDNTQYSREVLLKDPRFAGYQPDFLAVVLHKPFYTIAEAEAAVKEFWKEEYLALKCCYNYCMLYVN